MRAWEEFVDRLASDLGSDASERWLKALRVTHFDAANVYLEAGDSFQAMWFEEHVRPRVEAHFRNSNDRPIKVHLTVSGKPSEQAPGRTRPKRKREPQKPFVLEPDSLDPNLGFENVVTWDGNLLAMRLLSEIVSGETELATFNPIYLSGALGSGKSHLLQATALGLQEAGFCTLYVRGATFTQHMVGAIRANAMPRFREMYRNVDVLLVDDIDILSGKGTTQEEFFHTFNSLHLAGKQILLSANCAPQELPDVEARLVSRFEWGIVVPVERPDDAQLKRLLEAKVKALDFELTPPVTSFLLENFGRNSQVLIRALEALVLRVHINHKGGFLPSTGVEITLVKHLLADLLKEEQKAVLTPECILGAVSAQFEVPESEILSKSQNRELVTPRKIAMHLFRNRLNLPFKKIGNYFSRDHSTVMSSVRWVEAAINRKDKAIMPAYQRISRQIQSKQEEVVPS